MGLYRVEKYLIFCYIFTYLGTVEVLSYPSLRPLDTLMAHTAGCYCIAIDPTGRYVSVIIFFNRLSSFFHRKHNGHDKIYILAILRQTFCRWKCWFPCQLMGYLRDALCAYLYKARVSFPSFHICLLYSTIVFRDIFRVYLARNLECYVSQMACSDN